jgi:hypothetical protein
MATVLGRHDVRYYACSNCGFVQTEEPYWLSAAYAESIARSDIGIISRTYKMANLTTTVIGAFFSPKGRYVDYGGGSGMFVRVMRDRGFDFRWTDPFTQNQYARGFEAEPGQKYELVTAFEVFEHIPDPVGGVEAMLSYTDSILFGTILLPAHRPAPDDWWYYTLDTGQHVSLYSRRSLETLAARFGLRFYTNGRSYHLFCRKHLAPGAFALASLRPAAALAASLILMGRKSLLDEDYFRLTGKRLS